MTTNNATLEKILEGLLSDEHRKHGLQLCEDEDFIWMLKNGFEVARWYNNQNLTLATIQTEADKHIPHDAFKSLQECGGISYC